MDKRNKSDYPIFEDRYTAGEKLSVLLQRFATKKTVILALPRGGIEVAAPVSERLQLPLDVIIARKIADPSQPEFAIGAISEFDTFYINRPLVSHLRISQQQLEDLVEIEKRELKRRILLYRNNRSLSYVRGKSLFVIDDGVATGLTAQVALQAARILKPKEIIFAAPVCAADSLLRLRKNADEVVSIITPHDLRAVGNYYRYFGQVDDNRVIELLSANHSSSPIPPDYSSDKPF